MFAKNQFKNSFATQDPRYTSSNLIHQLFINNISIPLQIRYLLLPKKNKELFLIGGLGIGYTFYTYQIIEKCNYTNGKLIEITPVFSGSIQKLNLVNPSVFLGVEKKIAIKNNKNYYAQIMLRHGANIVKYHTVNDPVNSFFMISNSVLSIGIRREVF